MGNSLENVRKNTENAKEFETKALERGESVVEEVKEAEGILEGVKGLDVEQGYFVGGGGNNRCCQRRWHRPYEIRST